MMSPLTILVIRSKLNKLQNKGYYRDTLPLSASSRRNLTLIPLSRDERMFCCLMRKWSTMTRVGYGSNTAGACSPASTRIWPHGHLSLLSAILFILNVIHLEPKSEEGQKFQFGQKQKVFV